MYPRERRKSVPDPYKRVFLRCGLPSISLFFPRGVRQMVFLSFRERGPSLFLSPPREGEAPAGFVKIPPVALSRLSFFPRAEGFPPLEESVQFSSLSCIHSLPP